MLCNQSLVKMQSASCLSFVLIITNQTAVAWFGESHRSARLGARPVYPCPELEPTGGALLGTSEFWVVTEVKGNTMCGSVFLLFILCFRFFNIVAFSADLRTTISPAG